MLRAHMRLYVRITFVIEKRIVIALSVYLQKLPGIQIKDSLKPVNSLDLASAAPFSPHVTL